MNSIPRRFLIAIFIGLVSLNQAVEAANVVSISLCEEVSEPGTIPVNIKELFSAQSPAIHAVVVLQNIQPGTKVKGDWVSVDAINVPNYELDAAEVVVNNREARVHFSMTKPTNDWPTGNYKLVVYVNEQPVTIQTFSIASNAVSPSQPGMSQPQPPAPNPDYQSMPGYHGDNVTGDSGFSGKYTMNSQGVVTALQIQQNAQGQLTGTLAGNNGIQFQLEGQVEGDVAMGACYGNEGGVYFETFFKGNQLVFMLIEPDANNMPDYNKSRQLVFTRQSAAPPSRPSQLQPSNSQAIQPDQRSSSDQQQNQGASSGLLGNWQCQAQQGTLTLIFQSESQLIFAGEMTRYSLVPGAMHVQTEYGPVDYPYTLQGNSLYITFPGGNQLQFTRTSTGSGQMSQPTSSGQEYLLQGTLCRWSGSSSSYSGSSYSSSTRVYFDGQGNFSYSSESSFSSEAGMAYGGGQNPANRGTYRVTGNQVYLTFGDGSSGVATIKMQQNDGRITELMYEGQLYATGLCE